MSGTGTRRVLRFAIAGAILATAASGVWWYVQHRALALPVATFQQNVPVTVFGLGAIEA